MSGAAYNRVGDTIEETAVAAITSGDVALKAGLAAVAVTDYAIGDKAAWQVRGNVTAELAAAAFAVAAGAPVFWDSSAGKATLAPTDPVSNPGDFYMGILAADIAAAATSCEIVLNKINPDYAAFSGKVYDNKVDDYTVDAEDSGKVLTMAVAGKTFTLPATAVGLEVILQSIAADGAGVSVSPNAADKIMGPDVAGTDDKDQINTPASAKTGDYLWLRGDGASGWWIVAKRGIWAEEA